MKMLERNHIFYLYQQGVYIVSVSKHYLRIGHETWCLPCLPLSCKVICQIRNSHEDSYWRKAVCLPFVHILLQPILQLKNSHEESCRRKTICLPFVQILLQPFIQLKSASTKSSQDWTQNVAVSSRSSNIIDYIGFFFKMTGKKNLGINHKFYLSQWGVCIVSVSKHYLRIGHETWCLPCLQLLCEVVCQLTNSHEDSYWWKAVCLPFVHILLQPILQLKTASEKSPQNWTRNIAVYY